MNALFSDLSAEQARAYLNHVIAREDARLGDLAYLMDSTSGPIGSMDASVSSLVPLWEWFVDFVQVDCPGVPSSSWGSQAVAFGRHIGLPMGVGRPYYAAESLEHYLLKVVQRVHPNARWDVHIQKPSRVRDLHHNRTGIRYAVNGFWQVDTPVSATMRRLLAAEPSALDPHRLERLVMTILDWGQERPAQPPATSILAPFLDLPPIPLEDPRRQPPVFEFPTALQEEPAKPTFGEELVFAAIGADMESLETASPLDAKSIAPVLTQLGFTTQNGDAISPKDLTAAEQQQFDSGEIAMIETFAPTRRRLSGFMLEPIAATESEWNTIVTTLNSLGLKIGARLAPEGEF